MITGKVFVLNGPNLNLLGAREPEIYGSETLDDIEAALNAHAAPSGAQIVFRQSNHEGVLIDWVQEAGRDGVGLIINPGGYTHTSIALLDALRALTAPSIELHLSNIHAREPYRQHSITAGAANGVVMGFGAAGYLIAFDGLSRLLAKNSSK